MQSVTINPMITSLATRWSNWQSDFKMHLTANGITDPKENVHYCYTKLDREFEKPQKIRRYEMYRFRQTTQEDNEKDNEDDEATNNVRNVCEFADVDF